MPSPLPPLRLTGARVLRDGEFQARSLAVADGLITKGPLPELNLSGCLILPGIVDMQSQALDTAPAERAPDAALEQLRAIDQSAAAHGVTTQWLAQPWSWEGGTRGPDAARAVLRAREDLQTAALGDLRIALQFETRFLPGIAGLLSAVHADQCDYVVFSNRLPEALEQLRTAPEEAALWAAECGVSPQAFAQAARAARDNEPDVPRQLCRLAEAFDNRPLLYAALEDPDGETREFHAVIGARQALSPASRRAAAAAAAMGDPVILRADDLLGGPCQRRMVSALELVADGLCNALSSGRHPAALAQAAWHLADSGVLSLSQAWDLIAANPARIMHLPDRGRLTPGRRADFTVIREDTRRVEMTVSAGRLTHASDEIAQRLAVAGSARPLAAE